MKENKVFGKATYISVETDISDIRLITYKSRYVQVFSEHIEKR